MAPIGARRRHAPETFLKKTVIIECEYGSGPYRFVCERFSFVGARPTSLRRYVFAGSCGLEMNAFTSNFEASPPPPPPPPFFFFGGGGGGQELFVKKKNGLDGSTAMKHRRYVEPQDRRGCGRERPRVKLKRVVC